MEPTGQCLFPQLPAHLEERILELLPHNEIPCNLRLVSKAAAARLRTAPHSTILLSKPVPKHTFAHRYAPDSPIWHTLPLHQRLDVICATAASGCLTNLDLAVRGAGCLFLNRAMDSAARAGHLHACLWLRNHGCPWGTALQAAAGAGHRVVCEGLLAAGCAPSPDVACHAARGGHTELLEWLMLHVLSPEAPLDDTHFIVLISAAAHGCRLADLQRLYGEWQSASAARMAAALVAEPPVPPLPPHNHPPRLLGQSGQWRAGQKEDALAAAAGSLTPDWRAKVEWLENLGALPLTTAACDAAAGCGLDALERLTWLRGRGYPLGPRAAIAAARCGSVPALRYIVEEASVVLPVAQVSAAAAEAGHQGVLAYLQQLGWDMRSSLEPALIGRRTDLVTWLIQSYTYGKLDLGFHMEVAVIRSGQLELLEWMREREWQMDWQSMAVAAEAGAGAHLEWLVAHGCPLPTRTQDLYKEAAYSGDLATLRCLRRLEVPWGSPHVFTVWVAARAPLDVLAWMLAEGCPVDWSAAATAVRARPDGSERQVVTEWLEEQRKWHHLEQEWRLRIREKQEMETWRQKAELLKQELQQTRAAAAAAAVVVAGVAGVRLTVGVREEAGEDARVALGWRFEGFTITQ